MTLNLIKQVDSKITECLKLKNIAGDFSVQNSFNISYRQKENVKNIEGKQNLNNENLKNQSKAKIFSLLEFNAPKNFSEYTDLHNNEKIDAFFLRDKKEKQSKSISIRASIDEKQEKPSKRTYLSMMNNKLTDDMNKPDNNQNKLESKKIKKSIIEPPLKSRNTKHIIIPCKSMNNLNTIKEEREKCMSYLYCPIMHEYAFIRKVSYNFIYLVGASI